MTKVKMLRTIPVSPTGIFTETWAAGSEHDVADDLLRQLINAGACEIVEAKAFAVAPENKRGPGRPRKVRA